ncbi:MAG TPA: hypothetical protein VGS41_14265, partial [Chthonomonadales bacterium]|nr:hypothetical protein [Chthonomonadales bacterium]
GSVSSVIPLFLLIAGASPHQVFPKLRMDVDHVLSRPYDRNVPFGSSGDRVWATSPQGWAFQDGVNLIYVTNLSAFDLTVIAGGVNYTVARAEYMPSHVHCIGAPGSTETAAASFTYTTDNAQNPLTTPFKPEKRWTCWSSGHRTDWYRVNLSRPRVLKGFALYFYNDQPQGGCAPPESVSAELYQGGSWRPAALEAETPVPGKNLFRFVAGAVKADQVRITFRNRGSNLYTGLYGFQVVPAPQDPTPPAPSGKWSISADKWISSDDVLVSRVSVTNLSVKTQPCFLRMDSDLSGVEGGFSDQRDVQGFPLYLDATGWDGSQKGTSFLLDLAPGRTKTFTFACAVGRSHASAQQRLNRLLAQPDSLSKQAASYQGWFRSNAAYFKCSDPWVTKLYYHRLYNLKKNSMNPRLGALQHRTFSEGRWTSQWYANVISYGAGHQIDESRWLRDPSYAWGHLQTWTDNPRPDGIYPSHITPAGQQGGQYTDWISSTAWDVNLVHPNKSILAKIADTLARNTLAWRKVYGWGDSPLLVVDSHWWTGMEWQPSFFSFADYKTARPADETHLRRVDLTSYNYGNAAAVAKIYRLLGRNADAARMQKLADETRSAVLAKMWNPADRWFESLRYTDYKQSPAKEIIGLYPFAFDLPPPGKGYESAWDVALDPAKFWTAWPMASTSKDCPAFGQTGWPGLGRISGCMWNGPTWPHANSLVMNAMANTLRNYARCSLTRQKLYDLFYSFTRAQFRNGDLRYPWTGEYYNGDSGEWETDQRDYNHSTWIDPLIRDLIGIVPRADNTLEIDPLLPSGVWSYYVLDGQFYKGHDITVAWDSTGGHIAPGFKGYAVFVDGKEVVHAANPRRCDYPMKAEEGS